MKGLKEFEINLYQLDNKQHTFDFEINSDFFSYFENSFIENGNASVNLELDKSENMIQTKFKIKANFELVCDVSLEKFWKGVDIEKTIIFKYGEEDQELSEDVRVISFDTQNLNVASYIFEFIALEIPMKKVHPDLDGKERPDMVYTSENDKEDSEELMDPRWEKLKKLKN
jgi:uncharacterized metal-binding protein YceD (DUF177 family)